MTTYCLIEGTEQSVLGTTLLLPSAELPKLWFEYRVDREVDADDWWDAVEVIFNVKVKDRYTEGDAPAFYFAMSTMLPCNLERASA